MKLMLILVGLLLIPSVIAIPDITTVTGELSNTNRIILSGQNFGTSPNTAETAFLGGSNGWLNQQPAGTKLKPLTPFSTAVQGSEWNYVYSEQGDDDYISNVNSRIPGKNNLLMSTGLLTPSGDYDSTFGLDTEQPQQTFFISFWVNQHVQELVFDTFECLPGYTDPREGNTIHPQNKFFSIASHADGGQPGVVNPGFYGSNRNQWVIGNGRFYPNGSGGVTKGGFGGEWYSHHGNPALPLTMNICGWTQQVYAISMPYLYATQKNGIGGYNGLNCQVPYWNRANNGGEDEERALYGIDLDSWDKVQIWMKAGEFDTYDDRLIFQVIKADGTHINSYDLVNASFFTKIWGDNGEYTYPRRFFFYGFFGQDQFSSITLSDNSTLRTCYGSSDGWLNTYVDDFYIQPGSWAHVELGNTPIYEDTSILEIQKPVNWSSDQIEIELNTGFFTPGDIAYLFVIDENGGISPGYNITIQDYTQGDTCWDNVQNQDEEDVDCGGVCPNACPTCFDNVQNQDELGVDCGGSCSNQCPQEGDFIVLQNDDITYNGQKDACISGYTPSVNTHFTECDIRNDFYLERHLFKFDLSPLAPNRTIQSAKLYLTEINFGSQANSDIQISKVTKDWDSDTVTWNSFIPDINSFVDPVVRFAANEQPIPFVDVTSWVQDWYSGNNFGFVVEQINTAAYVEIGYDTLGDLNKRPKLEIIFEPVIPNACSSVYDLVGSCDGVDITDLLDLASRFGTSGVGDYDNSGSITILDLIIHIRNWD